MRPGGRRALVGVLSVGAMLVSAAGIIYMGAVSYPDELGSVDARRLEHRRRAAEIAAAIEERLAAVLDAVAATDAAERERLAAAEPLAARPFAIAPGGALIHPPLEPLRGPGEMTVELPERGFVRRQRALEQARAKERGRCSAEVEDCAASPADRREARRIYETLAAASDTGPEALLGLARLDRTRGRAELAIARYRELAARFGDRHDLAGVSYGLLADLGIAELSPRAGPFLDLYRRLLAREYAAPAAALDLIAERCRRALAGRALEPAQKRELEALDERLERARQLAQLASELSRDADELLRTASSEISGRAALWPRERTLVYRVRPRAGGVVGLVLGPRELSELAREIGGATGLREGLRAQVVRVDAPGAGRPGDRVLATVSFGQPLPHLALALVSDASFPDALDELAAARRRHRLITGGLVCLLVLGLVATVRGARQERELARLKSDFVSTVSHELKTPLTSIRMFAEMLREGVAAGDRERESRYHDVIVAESERLGLLIANLLDYSQIERGTRRYSRRPERAGDIAREAVATFQRLREGDGRAVELEVAPGADAAVLQVDRDVVVQSILNLLSNAAKYGGGGPIAVRVGRVEAGDVALAVADTGPGIPASEQARIFREFYRAPSAQASAIEGTGLGLALVKRHIEAQGGRVDVDSALGRGSTFTIVLPMEEKAA